MWTCRNLSDYSNKNSIVLVEEVLHQEVDSPHLRAVVGLDLVASEEEEVPLSVEELIHLPTRNYLQLWIVVSQDNLIS